MEDGAVIRRDGIFTQLAPVMLRTQPAKTSQVNFAGNRLPIPIQATIQH